jgi:hypothetical protein
VLDPDRIQICIATEVSSCRVGIDVLTYGQQRRPGPACPRDWLLRCGRSAVSGCGRGRHRSLCRSGGEGAAGLVGRCSSGCRRSCARGQNAHSSRALDWGLQCQKGHLALLWRHRVSGRGSVRGAPGFQDIRRSQDVETDAAKSAKFTIISREQGREVYRIYRRPSGHSNYGPAAQHLRRLLIVSPRSARRR